jgi:hypothetical protein
MDKLDRPAVILGIVGLAMITVAVHLIFHQ